MKERLCFVKKQKPDLFIHFHVGTAVITQNEALLWTDGRYFVQAEKELDLNSWKLMKEGTKDVLSISNWLSRVNSFVLFFDGKILFLFLF